MNAGFIMNGEDAGTGFRKIIDVFFGLHDHQVNIQRFLCNFFYRFYYRNAERNIRNKTTVHHIAMNPVSFTAVQHFNLTLQVAEVCRKN